MSLSDKDGIERNITKLRDEWRKVRDGMGPHWRRFWRSFYREPKDIVHAYTNLFVEARRLSPYLLGHIDCILYPLLAGIIVYQVTVG